MKKLVIVAVIALVASTAAGVAARVMLAPPPPPADAHGEAPGDSAGAHHDDAVADGHGRDGHEGAAADHGAAGDHGDPAAGHGSKTGHGSAPAGDGKGVQTTRLKDTGHEDTPEPPELPEYREMAKIVTGMRPAEAAIFLAHLSDRQALGILRCMNVGDAAGVLAIFPRDRSDRLKKALLEELP